MQITRYTNFLKRRLFPHIYSERVKTDFYSPIPNLKELPDDIWTRKSNMSGIKIDLEESFKFIEYAAKYCPKPHFKLNKSDILNKGEFYIKNSSFSYFCAATLHAMVMWCKPNNIIEVGSGQSSKVFDQAITDLKKDVNYTIIDPYVTPYVKHFKNDVNVISKRVQDVPVEFFVDSMGVNDILFVDSSHSVKLNSDVNFMILDVLPNLKSYVNVHFHDISLPYEYPKVYYTSKKFRQYWTEAYLLQAYLADNQKYKVLLPVANMLHDDKERYKKAFPHPDNSAYEANSGSFWIKSLP